MSTANQNGFALSVNLNKIALIRNSRDGNYPCVKSFGERALNAGAHGLTVHPRPDQRHIRPQDVIDLAALVVERNAENTDSKIEFNIEGNPFAPAKGSYPGLLELVKQTRPDQCTLVPDNDQQLTSDHGFDLTQDFDKLTPIIEDLKEIGVRISLFMDPNPEQIQLAKQVGADRIELYTGPFAWAYERSEVDGNEEYERHIAAAKAAQECSLGVNAGHDLNLNNMQLYRKLPGLQEVSIGHALTVDALHMGFENAVKEYLKLCTSVGI